MATKDAVVGQGLTLRDRLSDKAERPEYGPYRSQLNLHALMIGVSVEDFNYKPRHGDASDAYDRPLREIDEALALEAQTDPGDSATLDRLFTANVEARFALKAVTRPA